MNIVIQRLVLGVFRQGLIAWSLTRYDLAIFWVEWEKYPVLSRIRKWWNDLPVHFEISPVGVALSNAYIHSKDPSIPCLYQQIIDKVGFS